MAIGSNKNPSATKKGPGREHKQGHKKSSPVKAAGAPFGFEQRINPVKSAIHKEKRSVGRRQWLISRKSDRASARLSEVMPEACQQEAA